MRACKLCRHKHSSLKEKLYAHSHIKDECRVWSGAKRRGYGQVQIGVRKFIIHRLAWTLAYGQIPNGMCVLHKCDNPPCFKLEHLFLGTPYDNTQDMLNKGRQKSGDEHYSKKHPEKVLRGSQKPQAKIIDRNVIEIRRLYANRQFNQTYLAIRFGVSQQTISRIVAGKLWTHI